MKLSTMVWKLRIENAVPRSLTNTNGDLDWTIITPQHMDGRDQTML
jgi:hypothetical protein